MMTRAEIRQALRGVVHPSYGMDVVTLDMVRDIQLNDGSIEIRLGMPCPGCPASRVTLARIERTVRQVNGNYSLRITLLAERWTPPWDGWDLW